MGRRRCGRALAALSTFAVLAARAGCATAPPASSTSAPSGAVAVAVYQGHIEGSNPMPSGCQELTRSAPKSWTELDRTAPDDPYRVQRDATAAAGGNLLLVLDRVTEPRNTFDCPAAARITDCPPSLGAWYDVVFVSYACSAQGLAELPRERKP